MTRDLDGTAGANIMRCLGGDDRLLGRAGQDLLTGGAGADRFVIVRAVDGAPGLMRDVITDFRRVQSDRIDPRPMDDAGLAFIGVPAFSGDLSAHGFLL